jgi:hypothetical protein
MSNDTPLDQASREFDLINPTYSDLFSGRLRSSFQIVTLKEGLTFSGSMPQAAMGSVPFQTGPSYFTEAFFPGGITMGGMGDTGPFTLNMLNFVSNYPGQSPTANPESVPPIGPEERLYYSCVSGKCLQDPNGIYRGLDECLADECGNEEVPGGKGCDCGFGVAHTTFPAKITGTISSATGEVISASHHWWKYTWEEVTQNTARTGWAVPTVQRTSTSTGFYGVSSFEQSISDLGGNVVPATATLVRKRLPNNLIIQMNLDEQGRPWFYAENPFQVTCAI